MVRGGVELERTCVMLICRRRAVAIVRTRPPLTGEIDRLRVDDEHEGANDGTKELTNQHGRPSLHAGCTPDVQYTIDVCSVSKSCASFIYANGFLLLTVVFIPFPTALLGQFVWTDHSAPAVVLYNGVLAVQAIGWILISRTALRNQLESSERSAKTLREHERNGYYACALYTLLAIIALWLPKTVAIVTTITWIFWLTLGIRLKHDE